MARKHSRRMRHRVLLAKLVNKTDYYVAGVWDMFGNADHGKVESAARVSVQLFRRFSSAALKWGSTTITPSVHKAPKGILWFALLPKDMIEENGLFALLANRGRQEDCYIVQGWKELAEFVETHKKGNKPCQEN